MKTPFDNPQESPQEQPEVSPRKPRGRPKGSFAVRPDANQRAFNAGTLDELAKLSPVEYSDKISKRLSPAAFQAKREAMLLEIKSSFPEEKFEALVQTLREHPSMYSPEGLTVWTACQRELMCIIEGRRRAEVESRVFLYGSDPRDFEHCDHPHHRYEDYRPSHVIRKGAAEKGNEE